MNVQGPDSSELYGNLLQDGNNPNAGDTPSTGSGSQDSFDEFLANEAITAPTTASDKAASTGPVMQPAHEVFVQVTRGPNDKIQFLFAGVPQGSPFSALERKLGETELDVVRLSPRGEGGKLALSYVAVDGESFDGVDQSPELSAIVLYRPKGSAAGAPWQVNPRKTLDANAPEEGKERKAITSWFQSGRAFAPPKKNVSGGQLQEKDKRTQPSRMRKAGKVKFTFKDRSEDEWQQIEEELGKMLVKAAKGTDAFFLKKFENAQKGEGVEYPLAEAFKTFVLETEISNGPTRGAVQRLFEAKLRGGVVAQTARSVFRRSKANDPEKRSPIESFSHEILAALGKPFKG